MTSINKIYVDSRFRTKDSISSSNFKIDLIQSIDVNEGTRAYIDDLVVPNLWYNIQEGENNRLYIRRTWFNSISSLTENNVILLFEVPSGNYTGESLATALNNQFTFPWLNNNFRMFTASYDQDEGKIDIITEAGYPGYLLKFQVLTENELQGLNGQEMRNKAGQALAINSNDLESLNTVLNNNDGYSQILNWIPPPEGSGQVGTSDIWTSGYLNLAGVHSLYLHSTNMTSYNVLGCRGESSIIQKIPITGNYGELIVCKNYNPERDYIHVGKLQLKNIEFSIRDSQNNVVELNGGHISFVIILYEP